MKKKWKFWVDRGGTFTDIIGISPDGEKIHKKVLSASEKYRDSVSHGINEIVTGDASKIGEIRLGTTVTTNALLERQGVPFVLATTQGFSDILRIGDQRRAQLFSLQDQSHSPLYQSVIEVPERMGADGKPVKRLDQKLLAHLFRAEVEKGARNLGLSLIHAFENPAHEQLAKEIALTEGFEFVVCGHEISRDRGYLERTQTVAIDTYLSPILNDYLSRLRDQFPNVNILFMQSHGGLTEEKNFRGSNSLISGPAGGVVGAAKSAQHVSIDNTLAFDMGGTSTDIALLKGPPQILHRTRIQDVEISVPSVDIDTIAAGGGSILNHDSGKMRVGPESAGAHPGPACYDKGGPLTVTDVNILLGRISVEGFPKVFGVDGRQGLNLGAAESLIQSHSQQLGLNSQDVARGYLKIAVENIAGAISSKALERGFNTAEFSLTAFGGAAGQIACLVAERLKIKKIFLSHHASVLSALGMGLADQSHWQSKSVNLAVEKPGKKSSQKVSDESLRKEFRGFSTERGEIHNDYLSLSFADSETVIRVPYSSLSDSLAEFKNRFFQQFGYHGKGALKIQSLLRESLTPGAATEMPPLRKSSHPSIDHVFHNLSGDPISAKIHQKSDLVGETIEGPILIQDGLTTVVVEPGWSAEVLPNGDCLLSQKEERHDSAQKTPQAIEMEIYNKRFTGIAEQMGIALQKSARSLNIRERLDFSCALFSEEGHLIANAPHIPVHLGSMQDSVLSLKDKDLSPGDSWLLNSPYSGGTHLPDLTVVTPFFREGKLRFFVASRGHHVDIGGISPGSMPSDSEEITQEGQLIEPTRIVKNGELLASELSALLQRPPYPTRNEALNKADLEAQLAANQKGLALLEQLCQENGEAHVVAQAEQIMGYSDLRVQEALKGVSGTAERALDQGGVLHLKITEEEGKKWVFDFRQSSDQLKNNFNAPRAVVKSAVLYCLRCLLKEDLPLNQGCLRSIKILTRPGSLLEPEFPAAVVAGNVETSQVIVDTVFAALGVSADSQGTMNNLSFGNENYQYYETLAGGSGATSEGPGASLKQVHMTNSKLTDTETLECRLPIRVEAFRQRLFSGGRGAHRGGDGIIRHLQFLEPMELSLLSNRRSHSPQGQKGGLQGRPGLGRFSPAQKSDQLLPSCFKTEVAKGDRLSIETPGGGGYGEPAHHPLIYFAFGSNLCPDQVLKRTGCKEMFDVGYAEDFQLGFTKESKNWGGYVADIVPAKGHQIWGALYSFTEEQQKKMDVFEDYPHAYDRIEIPVKTESGATYRAFTYQIVDAGDGLPSLRYILQIYRMAQKLNFPPAELKKMEAWLDQAL